jgi:hypothetical protein
MKLLFLLLLVIASLRADTGLQLLVHTPGSPSDGPSAGASYSFPDTAVNDGSEVSFRLRNTSTTEVYLVSAFFSSNSSFVVSGTSLDKCIASQGAEDFTVAFVPRGTGSASGALQIAYKAYPASSGCAPDNLPNFDVMTLTTLQGNGLAATLAVSVTSGGSTIQLRYGDTIAFGQVMLGASQTATVDIKNVSGAPLALPTPQLISPVFSQPPFSLGTLSDLPAALPPGADASFTIAFTPTQPVLITSSRLAIGSREYPLSGTGIPGAGLQSLLVSYTLPNGVHYYVSTAAPIDLGSVIAGSSTKFTFTVLNPQTNFDALAIPSASISGSGYTLANVPFPQTLTPGGQASFDVIFSPAQAGAAAATLAIGSLQYRLTGKATRQTLNPVFQFTPATLASQQQAQLSIQFPNAPQANSIGSLSISFQSAVSGIADDPAILFVATGERNASATITAGSANATFNGQNSLTFQTGTTAGTLTFTLSFANGESYTKSVDIVPSTIQFASASATRQAPYLMVDLTAFDNTYSAGKLLFNFYDTNGDVITPSGITLDESSDFHQYFFGGSAAGGAFALHAKFPVTGDSTAVGSVDVTIQNSQGSSKTQRLPFQ